MSKVIIGIHGLGNKPPHKLLENWWRISMEEGLRLVGSKHKLPHFELVYWADILYTKPLSPLENMNSEFYLDEPYTPAPKKFKFDKKKYRLKLVDYVRKVANYLLLGENYHLKYSFLADKILETYFRELQIYYTEDCENKANIDCIAKQMIIARLVDALDKYKNDDIFLISHSMGTIIAYDVLSFYSTDIPINTLITIGSPLGNPLVISKIADASQKKFGTIELQTPDTVTKFWYNFSDISDSIAFEYILADNFKPNSAQVEVKDKLVVNNYVMNGVSNPHKSFGYLRISDLAEALVWFIEDTEPNLIKKTFRKVKKTFIKVARRIGLKE
jgi:hypothetical protein